jgi:hypothetical protein
MHPADCNAAGYQQRSKRAVHPVTGTSAVARRYMRGLQRWRRTMLALQI